MPSLAYRRILGFNEADRIKILRLVHFHAFTVNPKPEQQGEMEIAIPFDPDLAAKLTALREDLEDLDKSIRLE